jgi:hypothetical protein
MTMKVLIDLCVHTKGEAAKYVCMEKECDMPTVFVGMELWHETYGVGYPFESVAFHPRTGTITAGVSDECVSETELSESVDGWLNDGFVITGDDRQRQGGDDNGNTTAIR